MVPRFMRHGFHAVFSTNPSACDTIRKDGIRQVNKETKECIFKCEITKNVYEYIPGKIVASGMWFLDSVHPCSGGSLCGPVLSIFIKFCYIWVILF